MVATGGSNGRRPARMGRPIGSDSNRTRERLLGEALAAFVELGYSKATHDVIAARAGVSRTLLYRYFESKQVLYAAVLDWIGDTLRERTAEAGYGPEGTGPQRLAAFLSGAAQVHVKDTDYSRILAASLVDGLREPEFAGSVESWVADLRAVFDSAVAQAEKDGQLHPGDNPATVANLLFACLWGFDLFGAFMGTHEEVEEAMALLVRRVLPALFVEG
jgi:AcrR family transcriptional regulator